MNTYQTKQFIIYNYEQQISYKDLLFDKEIGFYSLSQLKEVTEKCIEQIPESLLKTFEELGWKIVLTNKQNLEKEYKYDYEIYGLTDYIKHEFIIYAKNKDTVEQSLYHEFGHFLDYILDISCEEDWINIWEHEKRYYDTAIFTNIDDSTECFADAFLYYIKSNKKDSRLCYTNKLFSNIFNNLKYIVSTHKIKEKVYQKY